MDINQKKSNTSIKIENGDFRQIREGESCEFKNSTYTHLLFTMCVSGVNRAIYIPKSTVFPSMRNNIVKWWGTVVLASSPRDSKLPEGATPPLER